MTSHQFYEKEHGTNMFFLSKDAICKLMDDYSEHRKEMYIKAKETFNTERWINHRDEVRKDAEKNKPQE